MDLAGRVVLITGARRVGGKLALDLADRGAHIALTYHTSQDQIEATAAAVRVRGVRALPLAADLSDGEQAEAVVARVVEQFGRIDAVVNMASIYTRTPFESLRPADFNAMIAANLAAVYHVAVAAGQAMLRQAPIEPDRPLRGKIVTVGDWASDRPYRHYLPYLVAKGALTTLTMALATELAPSVTVNLVQPAMIDPPPNLSPADHAAILAATPLGVAGSADDANQMILYFLAATDFATGTCARVDGGRFLGINRD